MPDPTILIVIAIALVVAILAFVTYLSKKRKPSENEAGKIVFIFLIISLT